jgi:hypothetical protein
VVSILLGHGPASLGDGYLTFENNMLISLSLFEHSKKRPTHCLKVLGTLHPKIQHHIPEEQRTSTASHVVLQRIQIKDKQIISAWIG